MVFYFISENFNKRLDINNKKVMESIRFYYHYISQLKHLVSIPILWWCSFAYFNIFEEFWLLFPFCWRFRIRLKYPNALFVSSSKKPTTKSADFAIGGYMYTRLVRVKMTANDAFSPNDKIFDQRQRHVMIHNTREERILFE